MLNLNEKPSNVTTSLQDFLRKRDASVKSYPTLVSRNLGNNTINLVMQLPTMLEVSEVANERNISESFELEGEPVAQRKFDPAHATKLGTFMVRAGAAEAYRRRGDQGLPIPPELEEIRASLGTQPYSGLQPFVANIRSCDPDGSNLTVEEREGGAIVKLGDRDVLWMIDGQHRRGGAEMIFDDFFKEIRTKHRYPRRSRIYPGAHKNELSRGELAVWNEIFEIMRSDFTVTVEVHLGLNADQERQLFHDLNNLGKKVESGLAFEYDNTNPVNRFIKEELSVDREQGGFMKPTIVERDLVDWHTDPGAIARKDLVAVNAILFLNKTNVSGALPAIVEERREVALRFWQEVNEIRDFGTQGAKAKTVAAQPVLLKALAKLAYEFAFGKGENPEHLEVLLNGIRSIDFSHNNPSWRYYELKPADRERDTKGLAEYLPPDTIGANRDIGKFDEHTKVMRFGSKHNDIFPILGDMIRWSLRLPKRSHKVPVMTN